MFGYGSRTPIWRMGSIDTSQQNSTDQKYDNILSDERIGSNISRASDRMTSRRQINRSRQSADEATANLSMHARKTHVPYNDTHNISRGTSVLEATNQAELSQDGTFDTGRHALPGSNLPSRIAEPRARAWPNSMIYNSRPSQHGPYSALDDPHRAIPGHVSSNPKTRQSASSINLPHAPPIAQGIQLVPTNKLPDSMRSIFAFTFFNAVQSRCFEHAYGCDDNLVLSAPTGSGKTVVMELAICRLLAAHQDKDFKVVYQAPTKSLCSERAKDWRTKFIKYGLTCEELTGDVHSNRLHQVQSANIIVATPEKWDSITRKWKDNLKLMRMIRLFLVDEVQILTEDRGATLEAIVSRMKSVSSGTRFIAVSATVPNSDDVATWLGLNSRTPEQPAIREVFGEDFRPATLKRHVLGFQGASNDYATDSILSREIPMVIARYSKRKPVMIFCMTKQTAINTAKKLAELWKATAVSSQLWSGPKQRISVSDSNLQGMLTAAVAYHHGGLTASDRQTIETGFLHGDINVICSTSTLAVGINLPCFLVVLKGTLRYADQGIQEYSSLEVMQMLGRAGRPQFEREACAVIMTTQDKVTKYEKMLSGREVLESRLHLNLVEHLNAEICGGNVYDLQSAIRWLSGTFLYVRLTKNMSHYDRTGNIANRSCDALVRDICEHDMQQLIENGLLCQTKTEVRATELGEIMARYYVTFETMKNFIGLPPKAKAPEILEVLFQANEFGNIRWRSGEKPLLKQINKNGELRYPVKPDVNSLAHKLLLVTQMHLGGYVLDSTAALKYGFGLKQDALHIITCCKRLARCLVDVQLYYQDATTAKNALFLSRSFAAGCWDDSPLQLKQINGIGEVSARKLASAGINSIDKLFNSEAGRLELILGRNPPYGSNMLKSISAFPHLRVSSKETSKKRLPNGTVKVNVHCEIGFINEKLPIMLGKTQIYVCFLCETSYGKLIEFRRLAAKSLSQSGSFSFPAILDRPTAQLTCHIMCDEIAGTHRYAEVRLNIARTWFSKPKSSITTCHETPEPSNQQANLDVDFTDVEVADDDLLKAAANTEGDEIEAYETECGELISPTEEILAHRIKRQCEEQGPSVGASFQLANGKWSCKHTCKDKQACNHKCCKEGTTRSKKRIKRETCEGTQLNLPASLRSPDECEKIVPVKKDAFGTMPNLSKYLSPIEQEKSVSYGTKQHASIPTFQAQASNKHTETSFDDIEQVDLTNDAWWQDLPPTHMLLTGARSKPNIELVKEPDGMHKHGVNDLTCFEVSPMDDLWIDDLQLVDLTPEPSNLDLHRTDKDCASTVSTDMHANSPQQQNPVLSAVPSHQKFLNTSNVSSSVATLTHRNDIFDDMDANAVGAKVSIYDYNDPGDFGDLDCMDLDTTPTVTQYEQENTKIGQADTTDIGTTNSHEKKSNQFGTPLTPIVNQNMSINTEGKEDNDDGNHDDEEQRAKWSAFEPWMYEEFGPYVELI